MSRWLHLQDRDKLLWFQAAGNNRGQAWTGLFRDADKNGFMEFADAKTPLKKGRWTHEINFLGLAALYRAQIPDLPVQGSSARFAAMARAARSAIITFGPANKITILNPWRRCNCTSFSSATRRSNCSPPIASRSSAERGVCRSGSSICQAIPCTNRASSLRWKNGPLRGADRAPVADRWILRMISR